MGAYDKINELRKVMGTLPEQDPETSYKIVQGVKGIEVELIDYNVNPYKAMYVLATSCWGSKINKWEETLPEHRFLVIKAVLEGKALPLALECANFTFAVEGPSRAAFDQIARTRVGAVFSAKGMRDNNWKGCAIRIPNAIWDGDDEIFSKVLSLASEIKNTYADIVDIGKGSWQAARSVLPLYVVYGYSATYNYASLRGVCANRMKFCEMEDTVAIAWLMAKRVSEVFPLLGSFLKPGCDKAGKCQYHSEYMLSEAFGCLFKECGRNECQSSDEYAEFNESCSDSSVIGQQLRIEIPGPKDWPTFESYEDLSEKDRVLFEK
jgi:thymidylate synthase ThyX